LRGCGSIPTDFAPEDFAHKRKPPEKEKGEPMNEFRVKKKKKRTEEFFVKHLAGLTASKNTQINQILRFPVSES
jgi:hypothetical protein